MLDPGAIAALCETAWPGVRVAPAAFAAHLASLGIEDAQGALALEDLWLAFACGSGDRAALATFEEQRFPEVKRALARLRVDAATADELAQRVRTKVLVGPPPRILAYAGRGSLAAWLRAVTVHEALAAKRVDKRRGPHDGPSAIERMIAPAADEPEVAGLRAQYAAPFKEAFAEALAALAPRDRNVLRLVYVEGLTAEQVGLAYGVHRVSVARWLGGIRETLFQKTRAAIAHRLALGAAEFESVTRLCLSQMDVSLERLLGDDSV